MISYLKIKYLPKLIKKRNFDRLSASISTPSYECRYSSSNSSYLLKFNKGPSYSVHIDVHSYVRSGKRRYGLNVGTGKLFFHCMTPNQYNFSFLKDGLVYSFDQNNFEITYARVFGYNGESLFKISVGKDNSFDFTCTSDKIFLGFKTNYADSNIPNLFVAKYFIRSCENSLMWIMNPNGLYGSVFYSAFKLKVDKPKSKFHLTLKNGPFANYAMYYSAKMHLLNDSNNRFAVAGKFTKKQNVYKYSVVGGYEHRFKNDKNMVLQLINLKKQFSIAFKFSPQTNTHVRTAISYLYETKEFGYSINLYQAKQFRMNDLLK